MRISDWSSDVCSSDLDPGRESLPAPSHQRERPTREGARQAIENRQGTESGAPMDLDHDEDGVVIANGHRAQKQEGKLEKDLHQTDKSGDSRSEERGGGKRCVGKGRSWVSPYQ